MTTASRIYNVSSGLDLEPIRQLDPRQILDVVAEDDPAEPLGSAHLTGWLFDGRRPIATYRLMIGGDELSGLFIRVGRRFELLPATPCRCR